MREAAFVLVRIDARTVVVYDDGKKRVLAFECDSNAAAAAAVLDCVFDDVEQHVHARIVCNPCGRVLKVVRAQHDLRLACDRSECIDSRADCSCQIGCSGRDRSRDVKRREVENAVDQTAEAQRLVARDF
jgi:hypothetical protein